MTPMKTGRVAALGLILAGGCAVALSACGANGPLEQPAPLFGSQARQDYYAQKAAAVRAAREQSANAAQSNAIADQEGNTVSNDQPKSTRDIPDPNQLLTNPRDAPVPGANSNLSGPTTSVTPPN